MSRLTTQEFTTLRMAAMFSSLPEKTILALANRSHKLVYRPGEMICRPWEQAKFACILLSGHVRQFVSREDRTEKVLTILGPGQSFGEAATLRGEPYAFFAEAMNSLKLLAVDRPAFEWLLHQNIAVVGELLAGLTTKLQEMVEHAQQAGQKNLSTPLAAFLLQQFESAERDEFDLPDALDALATQWGTSEEKLLRMLQAMHDQDLIRLRGRRVKVLDERRLRSLGEGGFEYG